MNMTPTERAAVMIELKRFPTTRETRPIFGSGSRAYINQTVPAPQAQFDAYAAFIAELYRKYARADTLKSGRTRPFSKKTPKLIRAAKPLEFERGMHFAIRDLGRLELLLTTKLLIFT